MSFREGGKGNVLNFTRVIKYQGIATRPMYVDDDHRAPGACADKLL